VGTVSIRLRFLGAARTVTGSSYLLEAGGSKILVDCGLFQERELRGRNWNPFAFRPRDLDAVLLTHGHLDHCGLLPRLAREGFHGRIYCTPATSDIVRISLLDSAKIMEEDAEFKRLRHAREGRRGPYPERPLYTSQDVDATLPLLSPVRYGEEIAAGPGVRATFHDAGHVLGSAMIKVRLNGGRTLLFSGDVGRWGKVILRDPTTFDQADYVVVESTYGDRLHEDPREIEDKLAEAINSTEQRGGNVLIPSFALERAQEVLYSLNDLLLKDRIPHLVVFVDSPMAVSITEVFENHPELFDKEMLELMRRRESPFDFPGLKMVRSVHESKAINRIRGTAIIMAGSGMCTGGRIKHHLVTNISRPESTVLFVGYQARGTLGREILEGAKRVRILGKTYRVRARIISIGGFSAHADRRELFRWISSLKTSPMRVFVTHGEEKSALSFARLLREREGWQVSVPSYGESAPLD